MSAQVHWIECSELRVGMFIHLDLGWWAHPFALSNFLIQDEAQLRAVQQLGVQRLRWSPARSELPAPQAPSPGAPAVASAAQATTMLAEPPRFTAGLAADEAACRAQLDEARAAWSRGHELVTHMPEAAARIGEALATALRDKLEGDDPLRIRALADGGGQGEAGHAMNVAVLSMLLARACGCDTLAPIAEGALWHDIGKLGLPAAAQHDDDRRDIARRQQYRDHPGLGLRLGERMGLSAEVLLIIGQHHERFDGSGFPAGLRGDAASFGARIVGLVDAYDRLCHPSPGGSPMTPHEALSHLFAAQRARHDQGLLQAFIRMMGVYPPGSIVQLTDERFAEVLSIDAGKPLKPRVRLLRPVPRDEPDEVLDLNRCARLGIRRSIAADLLPPALRAGCAPGQRLAYFFEARTADVSALVKEAA